MVTLIYIDKIGFEIPTFFPRIFFCLFAAHGHEDTFLDIIIIKILFKTAFCARTSTP